MELVIFRGFIRGFELLCMGRGVETKDWTDMAAWRRAIELSLGDVDMEKLRSIAQSRTEPASRVERARILLAYREDPSFFAVAQALGLHHQTVQRCVERLPRFLGRKRRQLEPFELCGLRRSGV